MREHVHKDKPVSVSGRLFKACQEYIYGPLSALKAWKAPHMHTPAHVLRCVYERCIRLRCYYVYSIGLMINARDTILHGLLLLDNLQWRSPGWRYLPFCGSLFAYVTDLLLLSSLVFLIIWFMCGVIS